MGGKREPALVAARNRGIDYLPGRGDGRALGAILRDVHRAVSRALQTRIAPHGVSMGQWLFLRALWEEDGMTQRELSQRVGMMEPTTVTAVNGMERRGLVERVRNTQDRRKVNIYLTQKGRDLQEVLLPLAAEVEQIATAHMDPELLSALNQALTQMIHNLDQDSRGADAEAEGDPQED